jgi:hypothetical protein
VVARFRRWSLAVAAGSGALVVAVGPAAAPAGLRQTSYKPRIAVTTQGGDTSIGLALPTDVPTAAVTVYVPNDWAVNTNATPGVEVEVGKATAKVVAADLGNSSLVLSGTVTIVPPTTVLADQTVPLGTAKTSCIGAATANAFWVLNLSGGGQTLQIPIYVHAVVPEGFTGAEPEAAFAVVSLHLCLPPPDVPAGTPGRAKLGARLVEAKLDLSGALGPALPDSQYLVRAIGTPYTAGSGQPNTAGAVEFQALDRSDPAVTLKAGASRGGSVTLAGRVTAGGKGVAGADVQILAGKTVVAKAKTANGTGTFRAVVQLPRAAALTAHATVAAADRPCAPSPIRLPCAGATVAGFSVTSPAVRAGA